MLLIAALGLARSGNLGLVALVIVLGIWAIPRSYGLENKSNASDLREAVASELQEDDLVISMQPEQGPLLAYHLEQLGGTPKLRFASPLGAVDNDRVMDWTDADERLQDATPAKNLDPLLDNLDARRAGPHRASCDHSRRRLGRAVDPAREAPGRPVGRGARRRQALRGGQRRTAVLPPRHPHRSAWRALREEGRNRMTDNNATTQIARPEMREQAHRDLSARAPPA